MTLPVEPASPRVSIVIATYNRSAMLRLAVLSVLQQDFTDYEIWVVGDACTDDSEAVVRAFDDRRLNWINLPRNSGSQSEPNNEGVRRARGKYVAYLGHDDLWLPWHLSTLVRHLEATSADLVHSLCVLIAPHGVYDALGPPHEGVNYDLHFIPPSSWLHRRSLIDAIGWWRQPDSISQPVDLDFTWRACRANKRIEFAPSLSVLKFPSALWGSYSRADAPQVAYLELILDDPLALRERLLFDLAIAYTRHHPQRRTTVRVSLRHLGRSIMRLLSAILAQYGSEGLPLQGLSRYLHRRRRRKFLLRRGLPPARR